MLKIGDIKLDVPFFQAPLSGYSDYAMRRLAYDFGCPMAFAGVMLAKSAAHPKILKKTVFRPLPDEKIAGAQILGEEPEIMVKGAKALVEAGYQVVDLNFACPARKVLSRGRGGSLMKNPELALDIYKRVRDAVKVPVIVKLRKGFENDEGSFENFWKIAEGLAGEKIDAMVIHGRTVQQLYRGKADWQFIKKVKDTFPETTVIGSGDLFDPHDILGKIEYSGVDGVIIARGAIGNPWIYRELRHLYEGGTKPDRPSLQEQAHIIGRHLEMVGNLYDGKKSVRYLRKFLANYCKLHPERKKAQMDLMQSENPGQLIQVIRKWYLN